MTDQPETHFVVNIEGAKAVRRNEEGEVTAAYWWPDHEQTFDGGPIDLAPAPLGPEWQDVGWTTDFDVRPYDRGAGDRLFYEHHLALAHAVYEANRTGVRQSVRRDRDRFEEGLWLVQAVGS